MRAAWRLAITNFYARRSRSLLLVATVALSSALIAAVACAIESINGAIASQVDATVGTADVRVRPATGGKTFDAAILDRVKRWENVARAEGRAQGMVTLSVEREVLVANGDGVGFARKKQRFVGNALATGFSEKPEDIRIPLWEGRYASAPGEIVIDATLARHLSWEKQRAKASRQRLGVAQKGGREMLRGAAPSIPEGTLDGEEAERLNAGVGVRLGDEVFVLQQALPPMNISAILSNPKRAANLAAAAGTTFQLPGLKGLFKKPVALKVVGIAAPPPLGGRFQCYTTLETLNALTDAKGQLTEIGIRVEGLTPAEFVERHKYVESAASAGERVPSEVMLQTTEKITSGLDKNVAASRLGFYLAVTMAFLAAAFIITTGMTTSVTERERELGVLRCIGGTRWQLAESQLAGGLIVGVLGAMAGVPMGVGLAALIVEVLKREMSLSLTLPTAGLVVAFAGAVMSGLMGAAYPAWRAARVAPLKALTSRAEVPRLAGVMKMLGFGVLGAAIHVAVITVSQDGQRVFWLYATLGLPALMIGYFVLSVPVMLGVTAVLGGVVTRVFGLPPRVLVRTVRATPYRHGFTAGAMMGGLALMVALWTQGGAVQRDWLGKIEFPDAFVTGLNLSEESQALVNAMPFVDETCAIAMKAVETDAFGVRALQKYKTTFLAFEPRPFFRMAKLQWLQGNEEEATRRLEAGGAVIVAREFYVAQGMGLGDTFKCRVDEKEHEFEIVGVVTSPGLEVVSKFFNVGEDFVDQAMHAVFGSRRDLKEKLGSESVHLIQIAFKPGVDDEAAIGEIRTSLVGAGILDAGSGRRVKNEIMGFVSGVLMASSVIAVAAMLVASLGVANLIIAGITARQFEFGVLRAVGATRGLVTRLVLGEVVLIAISASVLGTLMGLQGALGGKRVDELLFGIQVNFRPPVGAIAVGCGAVLVLTMGAAAPALWALAKRRPRELLGALRG
jgi:putative ABC transport system permease protein